MREILTPPSLYMINRTFRAEVLESRTLFAAGLPDATFNLTGKQTVGFTNQFDSANAVVVQGDGKILLAGYTSSNTTGINSFALARLNADGSLDTTFDTDGRVTTDFAGASAQAVGAAVVADNKILVGGFVTQGANTDFVFVRYNSNGSLDTTFGNAGIQVVDVGFASELATSMLVTADGNFVYLAGSDGDATSSDFLVARFNVASGTLDTTFGGGDGVVTAATPAGFGEVSSIALTSDGSIVAAGFQNAGVSDFAIAKFTSAGVLDNTFGASGFFVTDFAGQNLADEALGVAVQSDGKIVAVGFSGNTLPKQGASRYAILRLTAGGALDNTFATSGKYLSAPATATFQSLDAVMVLPDNRIVAVGTSGDPTAPAASPDAINSNFAALRFSANGALDTTFGDAGEAHVDLTGYFDQAGAVALQSDGRIVLAGFTGNTSSAGGGSDFGVARLSADADNTTRIATLFAPTPVAQGSPALFTLTLDQPAATALTFTYSTTNGTAIGGTDFTAVTSGIITFAAGETTKTITINTLTNAGNVNGADFTITITPPASGVTLTNTTASATVLGTSQSAPQPVISVNNVSLSEPATNQQTFATFTVTLDRASANTVTVNYQTAAGSATANDDFLPAAGTVTFAPGQTTAVIQVPVLADAIDEGAESFVVNLSNPTNATLSSISQGIATILNTPTTTPSLPTVSVNNVTTAEPDIGQTRFVSFTVTLSAAATSDVTISFTTQDGTATSNLDYTPLTGQLVIAAGQTTGTINIAILQDAVVDNNETFQLILTNAVGAILPASTVGTATLTDTPPGSSPLPTVTVSAPTSFTERLSNRSLLNFTVTLSAASADTVTVNFTTADGTALSSSDYIASSGTLTFAPGETSKTVSIVVNGDIVQEGDETLSLTLSTPSNATLATSTATATITNANFTTQTVSGRTKYTYTDAAGASVTVSVSGPGTATLYFPAGDGNKDLDTVVLTDTTTRSKLNFTTKARAITNVSSISSSAPFGLNGKSINLNGDLSGPVVTATVASVNGTNIPLNAIFTLAAGTNPTLTLGNVTDLSISSAAAVKTITVNSWTDSNGNDTITVPTLTTYTNKSNSAVLISATGGSIKTFSVKGNITSGGATATDSISTVSAAAIDNARFDAANLLNKVTARGAISNSVLRGGNRVGTITTAALNSSRVLAGLPASTTNFPAAPTDFAVGSAVLTKITTKSFSNSRIFAPTITSATLGNIDTAPTSGLAADTIRSVVYTLPNAKKSTARNLSESGQSVTSGAFSIKLV